MSADASVSAFLHAAATCVNVAAFKTRQFLSAPLEGGSAPLLLPSFTVTCFFFSFASLSYQTQSTDQRPWIPQIYLLVFVVRVFLNT